MDGIDIQELLNSQIFIWIVVGLVGFIIIAILYAIMSRKPQRRSRSIVEQLRIDVEALDSSGPSATAQTMEFYGTPVRLAVLVAAPQGRGVASPNHQQLMALLDRIIPGMSGVVQTHDTNIIEWPTQLSDEGFGQKFSHNLALPGDAGRQTKWCSIAGPMSIGVGQMLIGLLCVADDENMLTHYVVKNDGQWRDMIKVKN